MSRVQLIDITKRYGSTLAVDRFNADIADGEFITLLGPSGCGKTTTLRMVAGLVEPTAGQIRFDGQVMNNVPSHKRNIGLAFQSHALFPHLSVARNIAFGLEVKGTPKAGDSASGARNARHDRALVSTPIACRRSSPGDSNSAWLWRECLPLIPESSLRRAALRARPQSARHAEVLDPGIATTDAERRRSTSRTTSPRRLRSRIGSSS